MMVTLACQSKFTRPNLTKHFFVIFFLFPFLFIGYSLHITNLSISQTPCHCITVFYPSNDNENVENKIDSDERTYGDYRCQMSVRLPYSRGDLTKTELLRVWGG